MSPFVPSLLYLYLCDSYLVQFFLFEYVHSILIIRSCASTYDRISRGKVRAFVQSCNFSRNFWARASIHVRSLSRNIHAHASASIRICAFAKAPFLVLLCVCFSVHMLPLVSVLVVDVLCFYMLFCPTHSYEVTLAVAIEHRISTSGVLLVIPCVIAWNLRNVTPYNG